MANAEQVQRQEGRDKTPAEKSAELVSRVEGRFAGTHAATILQAANEEPGTQDAERDLGEKITGLARAEQTLQEVVGNGEYKNLSVDDKVRFAGALDKAKFYAMHALAEPADLEQMQRGWETAVDNLKTRSIASLERARAALSGELSADDIQKLSQETIPSHEVQALQDYLVKAPDLTSPDKERLLAMLAARIEELHGAEATLAELAAQKQLPPGEKDASMRTYQAAAENYKRSQQSLRGFLTRLEGYRPQ